MASKKIKTTTEDGTATSDIIKPEFAGKAGETTKDNGITWQNAGKVEPGLKIFAFGAENIKRLKVVQIHPKTNMVQITGENEQGKSSVMDAIEWGLCGTRTLTSAPIRQGE